MCNNSANIDPRETILLPFDSSWCDESNGIKYIEIQSLDQFPKLKNIKWFLSSNSVNIDYRDMSLPPFDSSWWGDSNELLIVFLQSLGTEKFSKMLNGAVNVNQEI